MYSSGLISRVNRSIALGALLAFTTLGLFGHSLHALLPCGDESCGVDASAAERASCSCGHSHAATAHRRIDSAEQESAPRVSVAKHDSANCPLCTLLAKIKVDRPAIFHARYDAAHCEQLASLGESLLPQDLALSGAPRGPPQA